MNNQYNIELGDGEVFVIFDQEVFPGHVLYNGRVSIMAHVSTNHGGVPSWSQNASRVNIGPNKKPNP